jgi:hypothetical protein
MRLRVGAREVLFALMILYALAFTSNICHGHGDCTDETILASNLVFRDKKTAMAYYGMHASEFYGIPTVIKLTLMPAFV